MWGNYTEWGTFIPQTSPPNFLRKLHYFAMPTMCFSEKEDANILHTFSPCSRDIWNGKAKGVKICSKPIFKQSLGFFSFPTFETSSNFGLHKSTMFVAAHNLVITKSLTCILHAAFLGPEWTSTCQCTIQWMPIMTQFWMKLNWVNISGFTLVTHYVRSRFYI